jgi:2-keto-4-pentenoate hydratase/2-oxohepta-3-ene-1,7-dioic acid hydratase in catechol pathway
MKLATFRVATPVGPFDRLGIVRVSAGDARNPTGHVVDANFAYAAIAAAAGAPNPNLRADAYCPADLQAYAELHGCARDILDEVADWAAAEDIFADPAARSGPRGERVVYGLDEVQFRPPIGRVPVLRDFAAFEDHLQTTFAKMGLEIPPVWYERPTAFKGNPTTLYGHGETVPWPPITEKLDYELELAAVIGAPGVNIDLETSRPAKWR